MMSTIPEEFLKIVESMPGVDAVAFSAAMSEVPAVSVKLNRRKCADITELGYGSPAPVKWCSNGFYLDERPQFTLNPLLHAGVFYVQDASSMVHEEIVRRLVAGGVLDATSVVADFCAAPGGKTTSIINALPDGALMVANEFEPRRAAILKENLLKWGYPEMVVTNSPTSRLASLGEVFDLVAVDAPCSGEGMMRKDETARTQWNPGLVTKCAALQREILADAVAALKPGGILIYSTCTFNRTEDEDNVSWIAAEAGLEPVDMELPAEWRIGASLRPDVPALRFMPHLTRGEGLFVAVLRKPGESATTNRRKLSDALRRQTRVILDGIPTVTLKGKLEIPASEWTLAVDFPIDNYPFAELGKETALSYLRHEAITLSADTPKGYVVVCYKGHPLGFVKNIGNRANNLFPANWKIKFL